MGAFYYLESLIKNSKINFLFIIPTHLKNKINYKTSTIDSVNPLKFKALIASATSGDIEQRLVSLFKEKSVKTFQFVDMWNNYKKRFTFNENVILPDVILVNDILAKREAQLDGLNETKIEVVGHPRFETITKKKNDSRSKNIIVIDQPIKKYYGCSLGFNEVQILEELSNLDQDNLYYLKHPDNDHIVLPDNIKEAKLNMLHDAKCIMGVFSSLLVESFLNGIPTLSYQPNNSEHILFPLSRLGYVKSTNDLNIVKNFFSEPHNYRIKDGNNFMKSLHGSTDKIKKILEESL